MQKITLKLIFFFQPRKLGPLEIKPCNNVEETDAQEFIDELTVLANIVCTKIHITGRFLALDTKGTNYRPVV